MNLNLLTAKTSVVKKVLTIFFTIFSAISLFAQQKNATPVYTKAATTINGYYESLPLDYANNPNKKYPLIIFLHGLGELGNGSTTQLPLIKNKSGLMRHIDRGLFPASFRVNNQDFSFIVLAPQFTGQGGWATSVTEFIDHALSKYRVDEARIYLTGLSMGGGFAFDYVGTNQKHAAKIAAVLGVVQASGSTAAKATNYANLKTPIWLTVNSGDAAHYVTYARDAVARIKALYSTSTSPWLTVFNKSGHDAWTTSYSATFKQDGYNVFEWMLLHTKSSSSNSNQNSTKAPPTAKVANPWEVVQLPTTTTTIDASSSTASSGTTISSYAWTKISGASSGTITSPNSAKTTITGLTIPDLYVYEVKVTDNTGKTSTARQEVAVIPQAPAANAGSNQTITLPTNSVVLDGSASSFGMGATAKSYSWSKVSGGAASIATSGSAKTTVTGLTAGSYVFELKIENNYNVTSTARVTVTVNAATSSSTAAPTAKTSGSWIVVQLPASAATLDASSSTAASGATISSYSWTKVSGAASGTISSANSAKATVTGLTIPDLYVYEVKVTDNTGKTSTARQEVAVIPQAPVANAGSNQSITLPTNSVVLDGSASSFGIGAAVKSYSWSKVSGGTATITTSGSAKTTVTGLTAGTYVFELKIENNYNVTSTARITVTVNAAVAAAPAVSPIANAGPDQTIILPTSSTVLDASASTSGAGATIKSYSWTKLSGGYAWIATPYSMRSNVTGLAAGTYVFQLTVENSFGASSTSKVTVTVTNATASVTTAPPTAKVASSWIVVELPSSTATLDASSSTASAGTTISSYSWTKISGGSAGTITSPNSARTTITGLSVSDLNVYEVKVTDNTGKSSTARVEVAVIPQSPTANAGSNQTITLPTSSIVLDGSASSFGIGASARLFTWSKVSGPSTGWIATPYSMRSNVTGLSAGTYVFELKIENNYNVTSTARVTVTVKAAAAVVTSAITPLTVKVNPNPVLSDMNVIIDGSVAGKASVQVFSAQGALLLQKETVKVAGLNSIKLDASGLARGIYTVYVIIDGGKERAVTQIIKE